MTVCGVGFAFNMHSEGFGIPKAWSPLTDSTLYSKCSTGHHHAPHAPMEQPAFRPAASIFQGSRFASRAAHISSLPSIVHISLSTQSRNPRMQHRYTPSCITASHAEIVTPNLRLSSLPGPHRTIFFPIAYSPLAYGRNSTGSVWAI